MERGPIDKILDTGIKAINTCLTIGQGQRVGLMAGSGVGKSVLLGMLTRNTEADVVVIGLIGERGREVQEFIHNILGKRVWLNLLWWQPRQYFTRIALKSHQPNPFNC